MTRTGLTVGAVAVAMLMAAGGGAAQASSGPRLAVSPETVVAGNALNVKVARTHGRRCVLSLRADRRGALVRLKRTVVAGHTRLGIPITSAEGARVITLRCGSHKVAARFTVVAAPTGLTGPKDGIAPVTPSADEQGFVAGSSGTQSTPPSGGQLGGGDYANSRIADIGLSKVGQNLYTPGALDHGQCKQAVNDWVAEASGRSQVMGVDYYSNYARNGGSQVSRDDAAKGDIIQLDNPSDISNYYHGMHTAVVVGHTPGSDTFDVVDSNWQLDDVVRHHAWDPYASGRKYGLRVTIWRMGTADAPVPAPQPPPPTQPPPPPATTYAETTGGNTNTWTNYTNAGGAQGPTIPSNQTVQIACKIPGFAVADGNTWWYRIASSPWNGAYYASADAFYNNGATSGSLHGTPFMDPNVQNC